LSNHSNKECNDSSNFCFFSLSPCELTLLATAVSLILAEGTDGCQREVLGNFILSVGQNIVTFASQDNCLNK
jgi:hypothetical protein